jgi:hypothetical protein
MDLQNGFNGIYTIASNIILIKMNIIHPYINVSRYKNMYTLDASRLEIVMRKLVPK